MPRPPSSAIQIALRIPAEWLEEVDRLTTKLVRPGMSSTRSDVLRAAIAKGLEVFRAELDEPSTPPKKRPTKK